jgi:hypothetical protein
MSVDATNLRSLRGANAVVRNPVALHCRVHHTVLHTIGTRTELLTAVRPSSNFPRLCCCLRRKMSHPILPTEIWEQTTLEMTIDDIVALSLVESHAR